MRVMVLIKANKDTEAGMLPSQEPLTQMRVSCWPEKDCAQVQKGARIKFSGSKRSVMDGPFTETKELIAGFWMWKVNSLQDAIDWSKRCPNPTGEEAEIEIRPLFEAEDFGPQLTPELKEQEQRLRALSEQRVKSANR